QLSCSPFATPLRNPRPPESELQLLSGLISCRSASPFSRISRALSAFLEAVDDGAIQAGRERRTGPGRGARRERGEPCCIRGSSGPRKLGARSDGADRLVVCPYVSPVRAGPCWRSAWADGVARDGASRRSLQAH